MHVLILLYAYVRDPVESVPLCCASCDADMLPSAHRSSQMASLYRFFTPETSARTALVLRHVRHNVTSCVLWRATVVTLRVAVDSDHRPKFGFILMRL